MRPAPERSGLLRQRIMESKIIAALDVPTAADAAQAVREIGDAVSFYKVGLELFLAAGPQVLEMLRGEGKKIFLDLKFHDIPRTVAHAVRSVLAYGPDLLTIHASGSTAMVKAAAEAVQEAGTQTKILAVTVLTSLDQSDMTLLGVTRSVEEQVLALAQMAVGSGAAGLVCSPLEAGKLRAALGPAPLLVTPGVRPAGAGVGDQKRVMTPAEAIRAGASYLVIGRPILGAPDRRAAAQAINEEMAAIGV